jgi:3-hydroxyisobutyrate dehydrogenase and related beta-hydroxyacid dehydrogenases
MASRLLDAGHSLVVFDTNPEVIKPLTARGAGTASSAEDVASKAEVVFLSLPMPTVVHVGVPRRQGGSQGFSSEDLD